MRESDPLGDKPRRERCRERSPSLNGKPLTVGSGGGEEKTPLPSRRRIFFDPLSGFWFPGSQIHPKETETGIRTVDS